VTCTDDGHTDWTASQANTMPPRYIFEITDETRYQGCHIADHETMQFAFYRYHIVDPVYFHQDIRVTMHQIGCWGPNNISRIRDAGRSLESTGGTPVDMDQAVEANGYGLFERRDDWSSCAWFYLDRPTNDLPPLAPVNERTIGLTGNEDATKRADA